MSKKKTKKSKGVIVNMFRFFIFMLIPKPKKLSLLIRLKKGQYFPMVIKHCLNLSLLYFLLYLFFYLINISSLSSINDSLVKSFEEKNVSFLFYFINLYPFNVVYIYFFWVFMFLFLSVLSLLLLTLLGEKRKPLSRLNASILYASSFLFLSSFPLLILNSFIPIGEDTTLGGFSFLVAIWISIIGIGILFSATTFGKLGKYVLNQNINRATFAWVFSIFTFLYLIYKTVA
jgi:hypothetical protein